MIPIIHKIASLNNDTFANSYDLEYEYNKFCNNETNFMSYTSCDYGNNRNYLCIIMKYYNQFGIYIMKNKENSENAKYLKNYLAMLEQICVLTKLLYNFGYTHGDLKSDNILYENKYTSENYGIFQLKCDYRIIVANLAISYEKNFGRIHKNYYINNYCVSLKKFIKKKK